MFVVHELDLPILLALNLFLSDISLDSQALETKLHSLSGLYTKRM